MCNKQTYKFKIQVILTTHDKYSFSQAVPFPKVSLSLENIRPQKKIGENKGMYRVATRAIYVLRKK